VLEAEGVGVVGGLGFPVLRADHLVGVVPLLLLLFEVLGVLGVVIELGEVVKEGAVIFGLVGSVANSVGLA
jgi:hypothetical protein